MDVYRVSPEVDLDGTFILTTIAPAAIVAVGFVLDILRLLPFPQGVRSAWRTLCSPFDNFLHVEDLHDADPIPTVPAAWKGRALVALAAVQSAAAAAVFTHAYLVGNAQPFIASLVMCICWAYVSLRSAVKPPIRPPYIFLIFAFVHVLSAVVNLGYDVRLASRAVKDVLGMVIPVLFIWVGGTLPVTTVRPNRDVAKPYDMPTSSQTVPEDDVTLWQWFTFSFVEPIFGISDKRTLQATDVWNLSPYFQHRNLFNKYLEYRTAHPKHTLLRFLLASNSLDLILDLLLSSWTVFVGFVPPYALQEILKALESGAPGARTTAYNWALVVFLAHLSFAQKDLIQRWHQRRCYERTRGQLFCALHYKSLKRQDVVGKAGDPGDEQDSADLGKIVNLMQGDSYAVAQRFWEFNGIFASPIRLVIALVFLHNILGWSAFFGVGVVLLAYVLNYPLAKYNIYVTRNSWKAKDKRMKTVNEMLQNIRFLKFYGWESFWAKLSLDAREQELSWRVKENTVDVLITFIWTWIPSATALAAFMSYTLIAGQPLTVSKAFTAIMLFSQLQEPMTALPGQVFALLHAYVSMQRIESFLREDEVPDWASSFAASAEPKQVDDIGFMNATFEWYTPSTQTSGNAPFRLGPLDLRFPKGKLTLVAGATGSGKSALLAALLGEMHCISGEVLMDKSNHKVAYCAQHPWLEHATIRDNIIFGSAFGFDEARYQKVIEACALVRDLEVFPAGDMTEIGEKGVTASGGQRARIALARAMYSQAQYILLDDPLAAVDMHTAQHIVKNCLSGELAQDRTIILVTHHIGVCLPITACLVELSRGQVLHHGTVDELRQRGILDEVIETEDEAFAEEVVEGKLDLNEADDIANGKITPDEPPKTSGKLVEEERRAEGRVTLKTYLTYVKAAGYGAWFAVIFLMLFIRFVTILNQFFLAAWGEAYETNHPALRAFAKLRYPWEGLPPPAEDVKPWLMIYLYISLIGAFSVLIYIALGYYAGLQASRALFRALLLRLTRAPGRFFDTTPVGRILNRFTTDINTIDGAVYNSARFCLTGVLNFLASFLTILIIVPSFAPFALFIAWLYVRLAPRYIRASRDLRRLESVTLSPAFAGFDELMRGITHVRAFGMERRYQEAFYKKVDKFQAFDHVYWLVSIWLSWRYDCLGSVVVFATTLFALWAGVNDGSTAIIIVQATVFAEANRQLVRVAAQLELDFNSVERVVEYLDVPQEAPAIINDKRPPAYWPSSSGSVVVDNLVLRYAPHLPPVLKNISFEVHPAEKVGVVGRTGSGKSTLALSLLRMVEASEGCIIIDGIDISQIGLEDLRTRITIVSQDVSLFSGTIRSNLDPMNEHSDEECMDVLQRCHLASLLQHTNQAGVKDPLAMPVSQGSLSGGERQLLALARAVLRRTNIIIMDEATSQIDQNLDDQIQETIRTELASSVVITIAHRLKTIIDYDRILVLDDGKIVEFDTPRELLKKSGGLFREMCKKSHDWPLFAGVIEKERGKTGTSE
ncbi:P-loop containing nucleoside triphosphate hydrolase protein [Schizophyllum commune Tattone D]|nr:P-loop containing nucleoside triphosphate hydrolase protein [Schizophyllum commune Tattone D]